MEAKNLRMRVIQVSDSPEKSQENPKKRKMNPQEENSTKDKNTQEGTIPPQIQINSVKVKSEISNSKTDGDFPNSQKTLPSMENSIRENNGETRRPTVIRCPADCRSTKVGNHVTRQLFHNEFENGASRSNNTIPRETSQERNQPDNVCGDNEQSTQPPSNSGSTTDQNRAMRSSLQHDPELKLYFELLQFAHTSRRLHPNRNFPSPPPPRAGARELYRSPPLVPSRSMTGQGRKNEKRKLRRILHKWRSEDNAEGSSSK